MSDTVLVSASEGVATVTLNRPDALNSFTNELKDTLLESLSNDSGTGTAGVRNVTAAGTTDITDTWV